jgi:hypothetical protein
MRIEGIGMVISGGFTLCTTMKPDKRQLDTYKTGEGGECWTGEGVKKHRG